MILTLTNNSGADYAAGDLPHPFQQFAVADSGNVATGVAPADLRFGEDKGAPAWKELNRLIQLEDIEIAATAPGTGDTPVGPLDVMEEAYTV
jgi:hypothetical protein